MKKIVLIASLSVLCVSSLMSFDGKELKERSNKGYKSDVKLEYIIPDVKNIPDNKFGELVKYGRELIVHTSKYIGPEVDDPKMRFAGNNNQCQNCHLDAGTKAYSAPFIGTTAEFPQYRPRENKIGTLVERINGCMERSMNGYKLPAQSKEMAAMQAYMHWLSMGIPVAGASKLKGRRLAKIDRKMIKNQAADFQKGQIVYANQCASCHGANGEGIKNPGKANGFLFPALWGTDDTYNKGAGMYRILKAADFIKSNMPLGATHENPILTDEEAYNVAAFMNQDSHYRPEKINRNNDFPDEIVKAPDVYRPNIESKEHQVGPYGKIIK
ncbi:MAG: cytochrome C [Arcobacter sp.]|mgnify:CR=1 FL=1|nr:cytochrome C [Arcobacter sp.]|tara:strand:+ start:956 stop:1936 length:981 start_codon:yes stop_codon:yes gene_type:complete